jgi:hypothetical protein
MDANAPTVDDIPVFNAPKKAPCPHCGKKAKRVRPHERRVRSIAYRQIVFLKFTVGEIPGALWLLCHVSHESGRDPGAAQVRQQSSRGGLGPHSRRRHEC